MLPAAWTIFNSVTLITHFLSYITSARADLSKADSNDPKTQSSLKFLWLEEDSRFDCIVGITVDGVPVGIGTLIYEDLIVTSANPIESYLSAKNKTDYIDPNNKIKVFAIDGKWSESKSLEIEKYTANVSIRDQVWIRLGFYGKETTIHDLIFITIKQGQVKNPPVSGRQAFYLNVTFTSYFTSGWTFAGFGYESRAHIVNNTVLEMTVYEDSEEVNCDEWIPRSWGRFICLLNSAELKAVQSGAPLFQSGTLRGIGCFHLRKGKESILVFTDFSLYRELFYDEEPTTTMAPQSPNFLL